MPTRPDPATAGPTRPYGVPARPDLTRPTVRPTLRLTRPARPDPAEAGPTRPGDSRPDPTLRCPGPARPDPFDRPSERPSDPTCWKARGRERSVISIICPRCLRRYRLQCWFVNAPIGFFIYRLPGTSNNGRQFSFLSIRRGCLWRSFGWSITGFGWRIEGFGRRRDSGKGFGRFDGGFGCTSPAKRKGRRGFGQFTWREAAA